MNRKVLLTISGVYTEAANPLKTVTEAEYFQRNGTHYVLYQEVMEGFSGATKNRIKFRDHILEIQRQGSLCTHMILEEQKRHRTLYQTPYGQLQLETVTRQVRIEEEKDCLSVQADYTLEAEGRPLSACRIQIRVENRN